MSHQINKQTIINLLNALIDKTKSQQYTWKRGIPYISTNYSLVNELSYSCTPAPNSNICLCKTSSGLIVLFISYDENVPFIKISPTTDKDNNIDILVSRLYQIVYNSMPNLESFLDKIIND